MKSFIDKFTRFYGNAPTAAAMAPGRLEILGNHTDYNQGVCSLLRSGTKHRFRPQTHRWNHLYIA